MVLTGASWWGPHAPPPPPPPPPPLCVPAQETLIAKAFSNWSRQNHRTFVAACEKHGRKNREAIYAEVAEVADKDVAQVKRYFKTFFERYQELSDWRRLMERIEKGEQKIKVGGEGGQGWGAPSLA